MTGARAGRGSFQGSDGESHEPAGSGLVVR